MPEDAFDGSKDPGASFEDARTRLFAEVVRLDQHKTRLEVERLIDHGKSPAEAFFDMAVRMNADALDEDELDSRTAEIRRTEAAEVEVERQLKSSENGTLLGSLIQESGLTYDTIAAESGVARRQLFALVHAGAKPQKGTREALSNYFTRILDRPIAL